MKRKKYKLSIQNSSQKSNIFRTQSLPQNLISPKKRFHQQNCWMQPLWIRKLLGVLKNNVNRDMRFHTASTPPTDQHNGNTSQIVQVDGGSEETKPTNTNRIHELKNENVIRSTLHFLSPFLYVQSSTSFTFYTLPL